MAYTLFRLRFSTGLHIGADHGGPSLDEGRYTIYSDTLFSALCCEGAKKGVVKLLYDCFASEQLTISDAMPFYKDEYYLPKPILFINNKQNEGDSALKKKFKAIEFIPVSLLNEYLNGLSNYGLDPAELNRDFGMMVVDTKVSMKGLPHPMPYNVAYFRFSKDSGLYIIVKYENEEALALFEDTLYALGLVGVGGKQSAGLGKFQADRAAIPECLESLLTDVGAEYQMLLGVFLPTNDEMDIALKDGWYSVIRRGGYIRSDTYSQTYRKKRSVYALAPGSCIKSRLSGAILDLSEDGAHPVWRCCKTLYAGVRV